MLYFLLIILVLLVSIGYFVYNKLNQIPQFSKNIIVTGASSGIGECLAETYAMERLAKNLVICARRVDRLHQLKKRIEDKQSKWEQSKKTKVTVLQIDVSIEEDCKRLVDESIKAFDGGKIDYFVLNAGRTSIERFSEAENLDDHKRVMDINYWGPVYTAKQVLPHMKKTGVGHFIVISSVAGLAGMLNRTAYSASKFALKGFFDALRLELVDDGYRNINLTMIYPGAVVSEVHDQVEKRVGKKRNMKVFMSTKDCADHIIRAAELKRIDYPTTNAGAMLHYAGNFIPSNIFDKMRISGAKSMFQE
ncbi:dehydrogenase/reductase SDR family protein [Acrasis kona]|uniref:Dehydrogenase/reductase SDR family protein n=1 Tax=Acrasis kona TaxID=1008807 RepID=A0AAW2ZBC0_9EUKA